MCPQILVGIRSKETFIKIIKELDKSIKYQTITGIGVINLIKFAKEVNYDYESIEIIIDNSGTVSLRDGKQILTLSECEFISYKEYLNIK